MASNRGEQAEQQIEHSDKPRSFENAIERAVILTSGSVSASAARGVPRADERAAADGRRSTS
jgi:hypothetical protein